MVTVIGWGRRVMIWFGRRVVRVRESDRAGTERDEPFIVAPPDRPFEEACKEAGWWSHP